MSKKLKFLGNKTPIPNSPDEAELEFVTNPHSDVDYVIRFTCPEFTSLCPLTSQPDFARIVIDYIADKRIIESKSLKLYLNSFRNHGAFHEDCTISIAKRIVRVIKPRWLRISGIWFPRGGIPIDIFYQTALPPKAALVPELIAMEYSARG